MLSASCMETKAGFDPIGLKSENQAKDIEVTRTALPTESLTDHKNHGNAWSPILAEIEHWATFYRNCF